MTIAMLVDRDRRVRPHLFLQQRVELRRRAHAGTAHTRRGVHDMDGVARHSKHVDFRRPRRRTSPARCRGRRARRVHDGARRVRCRHSVPRRGAYVRPGLPGRHATRHRTRDDRGIPRAVWLGAGAAPTDRFPQTARVARDAGARDRGGRAATGHWLARSTRVLRRHRPVRRRAGRLRPLHARPHPSCDPVGRAVLHRLATVAPRDRVLRSVAKLRHLARELTHALVAVRRPEREQRPIRPRLVHGARERRPREQPLPVRTHVREFLVDRVRPVRVEQERSRCAVCKAEGVARGPLTLRHHALEPLVGRRQRAPRFLDTVGVAVRFRPQPVEHELLLRRRDVVVEETVHRPNLERRTRILGDEPDGPRMFELQVFDDHARLDDRATAVDQHRHPAHRPAFREVGPRVRVFYLAVLERRAVLVEGREDLLAVRGERVRVECQGHSNSLSEREKARGSRAPAGRVSSAALSTPASIWIRDRQLLGREQRDDLRAVGREHHLFLDARGRDAVARRAIRLDREHHADLELERLAERRDARDQRPFVQPQPQAMAEVQTERVDLAREADLVGRGQRVRDVVAAHAGPQQLDRAVHPLARLAVRSALRARGATDRKRAVVARAIADERLNDVEERLIAGPNQPIREVVRMRRATLAGDRVDALDQVRAHLVQTARRRARRSPIPSRRASAPRKCPGTRRRPSRPPCSAA